MLHHNPQEMASSVKAIVTPFIVSDHCLHVNACPFMLFSMSSKVTHCSPPLQYSACTMGKARI